MTSAMHIGISLLAGFAIWALTFVALYGLHAVGCSAGWQQLSLGPVNALRLGLVGTWLLCLLALALLVFRRIGSVRRGEALARISLWATSAATVAALLTFAPLLVVRLC